VVRRAALIGTVLLVQSCAPKDIGYRVSIVTGACEGSPQPLEGVRYLKLRVTGKGIDRPPERSGPVNAKHLDLPNIPAGPDRVIEVRAYDGDPLAGAQLVSMGRSLPLTIPDAVPADPPPPIRLFLRKVNAYSAPMREGETTCQRMSVARAGHSATLLNDGRVLVVGGFDFVIGSAGQKQALADAELFDPESGGFVPAKDVSIVVGGVPVPQALAYHSATLVPQSGQVALWGGEAYSADGGSAVPRGSVLFYDAEVDEYAALPDRGEVALARAHHGAVVDSGGRIFAAGGWERTGQPQAAVEWIDPTTAQRTALDGVSVSRLDATVFSVGKGDVLGVAGGTDGSTMIREVRLFRFQGAALGEQAPITLLEPRRMASWAPIRSGADLIVLGGYSHPREVRPVATSEVITANGGVSHGPNIGSRGEVCAAALPDGRIVVIGGRTAETDGSFPRSDGQTMVLSDNDQGLVSSLGGPDLPSPRYGHTCTTLLDGTVLVTGGINEQENVDVLADAWIYQPAPLD
jgi:hypothetical protein